MPGKEVVTTAWKIDKEEHGLVDVQVQYVSHLLDQNMDQWPKSLQDKVGAYANKHGLCMEVVIAAVIEWVKEQHD